MVVLGQHIGRDIVEALGLPPATTDIDISIGLDRIVTVSCRFYPSEEAIKQALQTLRRYRLVEINSTLAPPSGGAPSEG